MLSALPAFVVGTAVVRGLASLGVSEVWSFAIVNGVCCSVLRASRKATGASPLSG